jgi:serine phosphatase RsbU (regulator of sigma subunit)
MAIRLRTRITLTFEFVTTLTIVVMSVIIAVFALGWLTFFYYQQGQMLNLIGQANIEYALELPDRAARWTGEQAVLTGLALGELVEVAEKRAGMQPAEIDAMLERIIKEGQGQSNPPLLEGVRVSANGGAFTGGNLPDSASLPVEYRTSLQALDEAGAKPVVSSVPGGEDKNSARYIVGVRGETSKRTVELMSTDALAEALSGEFDVEDVMTRFLLNADIDRIAIVNMNGEVEAAAGESFYPGKPIADEELVNFCVAFLKENERSSKISQQTNPNAPGRDVPFVDFLDVENEAGDVGLGVATLVDNRRDGMLRALFIQHSTSTMTQIIQDGMRNLVVVGLAMMFLTGIAALLLSKRLARPLTRLADAAQTIAAGNFAYRVPVSGDREIRILARSFNQMVDSIQRRTTELQKETQLRERLESDIRIGAEIQRALLPVAAPEVEGVEVCGWSEAAREVGGDFFDYLKLDGNRLGVALGDASGKGLPAALVVTECSSVIRALSEERYSLGELATKTNNALAPKLAHAGHFVTLFLAEVNARENSLNYTSAGHNPPLLVPVAPAELSWLPCTGGVPLGIELGKSYKNAEIPFNTGDTLVVYSDGITDARSEQGEFYGTARLFAVVKAHRSLGAAALQEQIIADVRKFLGKAEAGDDMSLLVVRRLACPPALA